MKTYLTPSAELVRFDFADILTNSGLRTATEVSWDKFKSSGERSIEI